VQKVKNIIQWKRGSSLNNLDRISVMRHDLDELKENERQLDDLIEEMKGRSKKQSESIQAYVTSSDLHDIDIYTDQMIMVVKAPPESQLILMDGDPPQVVLKSEKDEIDIFFCPDPSAGGLQPAVTTQDSSTDTDDDEASTSVRQHRKSTSSVQKRRNLGSAQRNLSKAFEEMIPEPKSGKSKNNLFKAFNATIFQESSDDGVKTEDTEEDDDHVATRNGFKSTTITTKDLMLLNDPTDEIESSFGIKKDVKLTLFSPQKNLQVNGTNSWTELPNLSPNFPYSHSDGFYPLEPDAEYNFLLADGEGVMDLFDYDI
jgi:hypothetical protein